jgi:hypothetical protein
MAHAAWQETDSRWDERKNKHSRSTGLAAEVNRVMIEAVIE